MNAVLLLIWLLAVESGVFSGGILVGMWRADRYMRQLAGNDKIVMLINHDGVWRRVG